MTKKEIVNVLAILKVAYPSSFKGMDDSEYRDTLKLWYMILGGEDAAMVNAAVTALIATRREGYTPTIGEVCENLRLLKQDGELTDQEAWMLVSKACRNGSYGYKEEFEKLPPNVQRAVGQAEQLREWALVDTETLETVTASNFRKTYRGLVQREEEMRRMPESVRARMKELAESAGGVVKRLEE